MNTPKAYLDRRPALKNIIGALRDPHTYNPRSNSFTRFGLVWGLPLSALSLAVDQWVIGHPHRLEIFWEQPLHLLFLLHPFLFGIVFGALGTVYARQDRMIAGLLEEQRRHLDELAVANVELKKVDQVKTQFLANVTHELKTPLVAIKGYNESILEGRFGPLTPKQRDGLVVAVRNVDRLERMIQELLEFERLESHEYVAKPVAFELLPLVQLALSTFQPQIDAKRLVAELRVPAEIEVRADYEGIRRVLLNLLSNAVKFSQEGGTFGVEARVLEPQEEVEISVWDLGPGIPEADQKFLFTRFWQADGSSRRRHGGTGLGLAIVKGILEAHGSGVHAESAPGSGTSIDFKLPRARTSLVSENASHDHGQAAHPAR